VYVGVTKDEGQRSPSTLLRAVSLSNGIWTFYEVVMFDPASSNHDHFNNTSHPLVAESLGKKIPKRLNQG